MLKIGPRRLLLDFHKVDYFSSTGFAVLFRWSPRRGRKGIEVKFCRMNPAVELGAEIVGPR